VLGGHVQLSFCEAVMPFGQRVVFACLAGGLLSVLKSASRTGNGPDRGLIHLIGAAVSARRGVKPE
jgi:hypothetical protein